MERESTVTQMGMDSHGKFSRVTSRDAKGEIVWRQRLDHRDRGQLREQLKTWPTGVPVVLEGTFGWGWLSDELTDDHVDHEVHLSHGKHLHRPGRFYSFFAYMSLFCFSMLGLVVSSSLLFLFIFW